MIYDNEIPISDILYKRKVDYNKDSIAKYLEDNLWWAITTGNDDGDVEEIPVSTLQTFKIGVYTSVGTYYDPTSSDILPTYGAPTYLTKCTNDKPGGIKHETEILYPYYANGTQTDLNSYYS